MRPPLLKMTVTTVVAALLLLAIGCAGTHAPAPPLWDPGLYETVAVLPARMVMSTGNPPFTSENTELSDRTGGLVQEALSVVMRYKGYSVLSPTDLSERLLKEDDLAEAFVALAQSQGVMGSRQAAPREDGMEGAGVIAQALGADLLVLAHGFGEYHSAGEALLQGLVTGLITRGKEHYQTPPSFLDITTTFIDPDPGRTLARFSRRRMSYQSELIPLSRTLDRVLRRVPKRQDAEHTLENGGEIPNP